MVNISIPSVVHFFDNFNFSKRGIGNLENATIILEELLRILLKDTHEEP